MTGRGSTNGDGVGLSLWILAAAAPPLVLRAAAIVGNDVRPGLADLRGAIVDLGLALIVAAAAVLVALVGRWAGVVVVFGWMLACYGNYEHIRANNANASYEHAAYLSDPTFIGGSALRPTSPLLLVLLLAAVLTVAVLAARRSAAARWHVVAVSGLVVLVAAAPWPIGPRALAWRQEHFVTDNLRRLAFGQARPRAEGALVRQAGAGDLDGRPWTGLGNHGHNVLLILMEGISGALVPAVTEANRVRFDLELPKLDRIARETVRYVSFISHQRQTNRGEYAILCGDYPDLLSGIPKMTVYAQHGGPVCLPEVLARAGYATAYLQAAPLPFMLKDRFMTRIGFERVHGDEWIEEANERTRWGVDDAALMDGALKLIDELEHEDRPWFLTLLTVGTHHPYTVPDSGGSAGFRYAAEYADGALWEFWRALEQRGIRDDTLILLSSDESAGVDENLPDGAKIMAESWGLMLVALPTREQRSVKPPFGQLDVPISVLDYLGETMSARTFGGRSLFREYETGRVIAFGNTYHHIVGAVDDRDLYLCRDDFTGCVRWGIADGMPFSRVRRLESDAVDDAEVAFLRELVQSGQATPPTETAVFELLANPEVRLREGLLQRQMIMAGQSLIAPSDALLTMEIDVELRGEHGAVDLYLVLRSEDHAAHYTRDIDDLSTGSRVRIRHSVRPGEPLKRLECNLSAQKKYGEGLELWFHTARLTVAQGAGAQAPSDEFSVELAGSK